MLNTTVFLAQNDASLIKKANAEFQAGNYNLAITEYRQFLAKDPKNIDFNFKYATCLYYTDNINNATKFYDFILNQYDPPVESYFFRGKIYQNNYEFQNATKCFEKYKDLKGKKDIDLGAEKEINYCKQAATLLKNPGSLKTIKRYSANKSDFFKTYVFPNFEYSFYSLDEVFEKQNSKKNFKPTYAFVRGMKYRFFASYGSNLETGKDIYIQKKNAANEWEEPIRLDNQVNSEGDEDYPFFDEVNGILYFSSNGPNSIGGYDLFKVSFDLSGNLVSNKEHLMFPYSSPNDDLFFIPDHTTNTAYFASNRNGELNKVEVFLIEISDKPVQTMLLAGKLTDYIDELNKNVQINLKNELSNEQFGPFYSDLNGNYLLAVPKAGKYYFTIKVSGSEKTFEQVVEIPELDPSRIFEQELVYSMKDSKENLEIINRFSDITSLNPQLELRKYKEIAKLDVNAATLITETSTKNESTLSVLGYQETDTAKAFEKLSDDLLEIELDIEKNIKFQEELTNELTKNEGEIEKLNQQLVKLENELKNTTDPREKYKLETDKRNLEGEIQKIKKQNFVLANEIKAIEENQVITKSNYQKIKQVNEEINEQVLSSDFNRASSIVSENQLLLKTVLNSRLEDKEKVVEQKENLVKKEKQEIEDKINDYSNQITTLKNEIKVNEQKLKTEKNKKEQERISNALSQQKKNLSLVEELNNQAQFELARVRVKEDAYIENKSLIQKIDERAEQKTSISNLNSDKKVEIKIDDLLTEITDKQEILKETSEGKYEYDIKQIQNIENEVERVSKLKEREIQYQNELKQKLASTSIETEKEILSEQLQLSQSRLLDLDEQDSQNNLTNNQTNKQNSNTNNDSKLVDTNSNEKNTTNDQTNNQNSNTNNDSKLAETNSNEKNTTNDQTNNQNSNANNDSKLAETNSNEKNTTNDQTNNQNSNTNDDSKLAETNSNEKNTTNDQTNNQNSNTNNDSKLAETNSNENNTTNDQTNNQNSNTNNDSKLAETNSNEKNTTNDQTNNQNSNANDDSKLAETNSNEKNTTNDQTNNQNSNTNNDSKLAETNSNENNTTNDQTNNQNSNANNDSKLAETNSNEKNTTNDQTNNQNSNTNNDSKLAETNSNEKNTTNDQTNNQNSNTNNDSKLAETNSNENNTTNDQTNNQNSNANNDSKLAETNSNEKNTTNDQTNNQNSNTNNDSKIAETNSNEKNTMNDQTNNQNSNTNNDSKLAETNSNSENANNEVENFNNSSENVQLKPEDLKQAVLYNLTAAKIEEQISIKRNELNNAKTDKEREKIKNDINKLESDSKIEYDRGIRSEKIALFNKQFANLEITTYNELRSELNEVTLREQEIQQKINQTSNDREKNNLKEQKNQLAAIKIELENKIESTNQKISFKVEQPEVAAFISESETESLRLDNKYQKYIEDRTTFNLLISEYDRLIENNTNLRELIKQKLSESESNELSEEIRQLAIQLSENDKILSEKQLQIESQLTRLKSFENYAQFERLIADKIQPAVLQIANNESSELISNFSIGRNPTISIDQPLPVNVNSPSGLVYRVQVGAFRKPIPKESFRDFSPVSGDVLANGLTCYMAGYFNSAQNAILARKQIRALGYADAFIVAYCDGKRVSFAQGRELENSGRCKVMTINELNLALVGNNPDNVSNIVNVNSENRANTNQPIKPNYLDVPNAKSAELGELNQHLFFTVQVGVYNKPITNNQLQNIDELITHKSEKGQIRYSTGMFDNLNAAKQRKIDAVNKGVADAYVVAYYQGKRISIAEATNLLARNGDQILKKKLIEQNNVASIQNSNGKISEIQINLPKQFVSKQPETFIQYELVCDSSVVVPNLERLNRIGIFTYQPEEGKIVSSKLKSNELTQIHQEYLKQFKMKNEEIDSTLLIQFDVTEKMSNGVISDWLLRSDLIYRLEVNEETKKLNVYLKNEAQREVVLNKTNELLISEVK